MAALSFVGAFGDTEQDPTYGSEFGAGELNRWMKRLGDFQDTRKAAIGKYSANLDAATGENQAVSKELSDWYRKTMAGASTYDPFTTSVKPAADYAFGKLTDFSQLIPSLTRKANNQNAMSLGLAPGARSSAVDRAQYSNAAAAYDKMLGTFMPWMQSSAALDNSSRQDQFFRALAASEALKAEPDRLAGRALYPMNVEAAGYTQDIPNLAALIQAANANIQGYTPHPDTLAKMGMADQALVDNVSQWAGVLGSVYGGLTGTSALGGMMGGMGGGGTGGAAVPTGTPPAGTSLQWRGGYPQSVAPTFNPWYSYMPQQAPQAPVDPYMAWRGW